VVGYGRARRGKGRGQATLGRILIGPYVVGSCAQGQAEPTLVDRGSSRRKHYHAVKPAHIRLIDRRQSLALVPATLVPYRSPPGHEATGLEEKNERRDQSLLDTPFHIRGLAAALAPHAVDR
jgi:hypothetical protein